MLLPLPLPLRLGTVLLLLLLLTTTTAGHLRLPMPPLCRIQSICRVCLPGGQGLDYRTQEDALTRRALKFESRRVDA
jgi:hypothetical protein